MCPTQWEDCDDDNDNCECVYDCIDDEEGTPQQCREACGLDMSHEITNDLLECLESMCSSFC
jgi:hypothetical protein